MSYTETSTLVSHRYIRITCRTPKCSYYMLHTETFTLRATQIFALCVAHRNIRITCRTPEYPRYVLNTWISSLRVEHLKVRITCCIHKHPHYMSHRTPAFRVVHLNIRITCCTPEHPHIWCTTTKQLPKIVNGTHDRSSQPQTSFKTDVKYFNIKNNT